MARQARDVIGEAWQKRNAAEILLLRGSLAEACRLAVESVSALERGVTVLGESGFVVTPRVRNKLDRAIQLRLTLESQPTDDDDVTQEQARTLRDLIGIEIVLEHALHVAVLDRAALLRLRRHRWFLALFVFLSPFAVGAFLHYAMYGVSIRASSELDDQYAADRAIDGDPNTAWTPKGGGQEWLEIRFRPRSVRTLRILNGDTLPDRASKEVRVQFYLRDEVFPAGVQTFELQTPAQWITFDVAGLKCDRVRVEVLSHYGSTAAIAEVEVK
jgi:hypothetical protein